MPQLLTQFCRGFGSRLAFGIERFAIESLCREGDAELLRSPYDCGKIRAGCRRGGVRITDLGAGGGIEHGRGIPHTAAHDVLSNKATQEISPIMGPSGLRARVGLRPTRPQHDAGMRIEPPPSLACASGTMPAATAAADPPEEPPVE